MSSSVVNDFLSALFDNTIASESDVSNPEPAKVSTFVASSEISSTEGAQTESVAAGVKRQREEEREPTSDQSHKRVTTDASDIAAAKPVKKSLPQPTRKPTAKPQYQPFQQQLLGSTAMSDPFDAYLASQKLNNMHNASQRAKDSPSVSSDSRREKDGRGKGMNRDSHPSHASHVSKSAIDNLPAEARMFIKKLPQSITHDEIIDHFSKYGKIREVVPKSGFGFVQFESIDSCRKAIENENGNTFKNVELVLEPCHKRPHHNRSEESEPVNQRNHRKQDNQKAPPPSKSSFSPGARHASQPGYSQSDKPNPNRGGQWNNRHSNFNSAGGQGNNRHSYRDDASHRNRPHENFDQQRQFGNNRHQRGGPDPSRRQPASSQKSPYKQNSALPRGTKTSYWPPQRRYGQAVPVVELVVWDNVPESFITYIEGRFRAGNLQLHTSYLQQNDVDKDTLMQHFVMEGVTAVIMVDRNDEVRGKVYMQVFERSPSANASNVRFDEYAGISVDDAVSVVARATSNKGQTSNSMMLTQSYSQATSPQGQRSTPPQNPMPSQQPVNYRYGASQQQISLPAQPPVAPAVDASATMAALLGMVQSAAQPNIATDPSINNVALQLLTSIVNGTAASNPSSVNQQPPAISQQYDPAYSQINYNPPSTVGYSAYNQPPANQMAYTTAKPPVADNNVGKDPLAWQHNNNQNSKYYPTYSSTSTRATTVPPPAPTTDVGAILAKLQMLQQQSNQQ